MYTIDYKIKEMTTKSTCVRALVYIVTSDII